MMGKRDSVLFQHFVFRFFPPFLGLPQVSPFFLLFPFLGMRVKEKKHSTGNDDGDKHSTV